MRIRGDRNSTPTVREISLVTGSKGEFTVDVAVEGRAFLTR
jgi:hypothetical protein